MLILLQKVIHTHSSSLQCDCLFSSFIVFLSYQESFGMTKLHKDIAMKLMDSVNNEEMTDQAIIKVRTGQ